MDSDLIERAKRRDNEAFTALVHRFGDRLYAVSYRILRAEASCRRIPPVGGDTGVEAEESEGCLSPDDLLVAHSYASVDHPVDSLTVEATGESFEISGRFAGWLQADQ